VVKHENYERLGACCTQARRHPGYLSLSDSEHVPVGIGDKSSSLSQSLAASANLAIGHVWSSLMTSRPHVPGLGREAWSP
jgi:hypothetical protein